MSSHPPVERAQPWLGTTVVVRAQGLEPAAAHRAIDAAFAEVAEVHALMSFQQPGSDVSRLNRSAAHEEVVVHPWTLQVLAHAQLLAEVSGGAFDIAAGAELVASGALPGRPDDAARRGRWRDIALDPERRTVRFARPLRIDLGGIAKGYAVDRAVEALRRHGAAQGGVNAGGDLRLFGDAERVRLDRRGSALDAAVPILRLQDASAASSQPEGRATHFDGRTRQPVPADFVCVAADDCVWADGLTKVALALQDHADPVLRRFGATAYLRSEEGDWRTLGCGA